MTKNRKVAVSNALIEGRTELTLNECRIIDLILMTINEKRLEKERKIHLSVAQYAREFNVERKNAYRAFIGACHNMGAKCLLTYTRTEEGELVDSLFYRWFEGIRWDKNKEGKEIVVNLSPEIAPFVYELKDKFSLVDFEILRQLKSVHARTIFYWLKMEMGLQKGKQCAVLEMPLDEFNAKLGVNYQRYGHIMQFILSPTAQQIEAVSNYSIFYEPVYTGKKATGVRFKFREGKAFKQKPRTTKPTRPKLPKCNALKGTHEYGLWARECIRILEAYKQELASDNWTLIKKDADRLKTYYAIIGTPNIEPSIPSKSEPMKAVKPKRESLIGGKSGRAYLAALGMDAKKRQESEPN